MINVGDFCVLALPDDPELFSFYVLKKRDNSWCVLLNIKKPILRGGLLVLSPEQLEEYVVPLSVLNANKENLELLYKYGSYEQLDLYTYSTLFGVRKARLMMICSELFALLPGKDPYLFNVRDLGCSWKAAFTKDELERWLLHVEQLPSGKKLVRTVGLGTFLNGHELQTEMDFPQDVLEMILNEISFSVTYGVIVIQDRMVCEFFDLVIQFEERYDSEGNLVYQVSLVE